jgi:hypothetical protein
VVRHFDEIGGTTIKRNRKRLAPPPARLHLRLVIGGDETRREDAAKVEMPFEERPRPF